MIMPGLGRLRREAAAVVVAVAASCAVGHAGDASSWEGSDRSAARLIAGASAAQAILRAGIELRLKPGWHTYWRYPGDAGVPPRFDFSASENVESVRVLWPAPRRITEQGLSVIGYTGAVMLPLAVVPRDRAKAATLNVAIDYAVCEQLCVPMQAKAQLALTGAPSPYDDALAQALARVPKKRALGENASFAIKSIAREVGSPGRVILDIAAPPNVDLFAEGPDADWALPLPLPVASPAPGLQRFTFPLDGAPPGTRYGGAFITLTAVAPEEAIETVAQVP